MPQLFLYNLNMQFFLKKKGGGNMTKTELLAKAEHILKDMKKRPKRYKKNELESRLRILANITQVHKDNEHIIIEQLLEHVKLTPEIIDGLLKYSLK
jgi:hypothetical protein